MKILHWINIHILWKYCIELIYATYMYPFSVSSNTQISWHRLNLKVRKKREKRVQACWVSLLVPGPSQRAIAGDVQGKGTVDPLVVWLWWLRRVSPQPCCCNTQVQKSSMTFGSECLFLAPVTQGCPSGCKSLHGFSCSRSRVCLHRLCSYGTGQKQVATWTTTLKLKLLLWGGPWYIYSHSVAQNQSHSWSWLWGPRCILATRTQCRLSDKGRGVQSSWGQGWWESWPVPPEKLVFAPCTCLCQGEVCIMSPPWFRYLILVCSSSLSLLISELTLGPALGTVGNSQVLDAPASGVRSSEDCLDLGRVSHDFQNPGSQCFWIRVTWHHTEAHVALDKKSQSPGREMAGAAWDSVGAGLEGGRWLQSRTRSCDLGPLCHSQGTRVKKVKW